MNREVHVRFCKRRGVRFPPATYLAIGVTVDGERDILGLWAGEGGEGFGTVTCSGGRKQRAGWAYSGCARVRAC